MQLKGQRALITGGTSGIGRDIALVFAKQGADVAVFGTSMDKANAVLQSLKEVQALPEQRFIAKVVNVADKKQVEEAVAEILSLWQNVDILINNAGITRDTLLMKMTEQDWDEVLSVNLKSVYNLCQTLIRPMMKARRGKIINISSVVGLIGNPGQVNYASSKAGMIGFTKALALEVASRNICVNCIAPGFIESKMTDVLSEAQKNALLQRIPLGRMGKGEEIAQAALFLSVSDYITGQVLTVDGGMVM